MSALLSSRYILPAVFFVSLFQLSAAQNNFGKPDPVKSETIDMIIGKWQSDPVTIMGSTRTETANHYIKHNGQYMFIDVEGKDDRGFNYTATIIMKLNSDGTFTGWSFDDYGKMKTYSGTATGNKISVSGKSEMGSESREIEINGNTMIHKLHVTFPVKDGKEETIDETITYHKM